MSIEIVAVFSDLAKIDSVAISNVDLGNMYYFWDI